MDELTPNLAKRKVYTVLDMRDGFFHLELDEESSILCTFHTPFGRYRFKRMPFGLASAPEVFQKIIMQVFGEIEGVTVYFDDLIIAADSDKQHDEILLKVVNKARKYNIKFNCDKMQYKVSKVKYIGQLFSENGMQPDPENVRAIRELEVPKNVKELQSILGLINYMGRYLPQLAEISAPLRVLLKKNVIFTWTNDQDNALNEIKRRLTNAPTLKCYKPGMKLTIQTDASQYGLGCCLLGDGGPLGFASRRLSETEQSYAQIEKELLSITYACNKFHTFIYGHKVMVQTDHKPLESILKKNINKVSKRLQRMCLSLLKYELDVKYLPGSKMFVADLLFRNVISLPEEEQNQMFKERVHMVEKILAITDEKLKKFQEETAKDSQLCVIMSYVEKGWPVKCKLIKREVKWAWALKDNIVVEQGLVLLNDRIIVPEVLQSEMLKLLHKYHFGVVKTKKMARQVMYWRGMPGQIEKLILSCKICEKYLPQKVKEPLIQRDIPSFPFEVVSMDIGSVGGRDYLIMGCYKTKWLEIKQLKNKTADEIVEVIKPIFSTNGIPRLLISDNVPFGSNSFKQFADAWGIEQQLVSPRYPRSNGFEEKMVGIGKVLIKKCLDSGTDLQLALLAYRNSPQEGMTFSPAQLNMSRVLRSEIPVTTELLKHRENIGVEVQEKQNKSRQKCLFDKRAKVSRGFEKDESVLIRNEKYWEPAVIKDKHRAPRSYIVTDARGRDFRRNSNHIRRSRNSPPVIVKEVELEDEVAVSNKPELEIETEKEEVIAPYRTRSGRLTRKPVRFRDYV